MDVSTPQLAALLAIADLGTFEAAARHLHVTPSAVSQRIRALESAAGQVLVRRGTPCAPTAAGERLVAVARQTQLLLSEVQLAPAVVGPAARRQRRLPRHVVATGDRRGRHVGGRHAAPARRGPGLLQRPAPARGGARRRDQRAPRRAGLRGRAARVDALRPGGRSGLRAPLAHGPRVRLGRHAGRGLQRQGRPAARGAASPRVRARPDRPPGPHLGRLPRGGAARSGLGRDPRAAAAPGPRERRPRRAQPAQPRRRRPVLAALAPGVPPPGSAHRGRPRGARRAALRR